MVEVPEPRDVKRAVAEGYDRIGGQYGELAAKSLTRQRRKYTGVLLKRVPQGAEVLDLGCGAGVPTTRELARSFRVTGVDISRRQVARARDNVPGASFVQSDMADARFPPESFDAVAAFYAIIHLPRDEQPALLSAIVSWLRPGGLFVGTLGARSVEADYQAQWLGTPMYWSSHDSETNRRMVREAGLEIVSAKEETTRADGESETFLWVVARKPHEQLTKR
jgi:SAM-dependent methyltransferase